MFKLARNMSSASVFAAVLAFSVIGFSVPASGQG